MSPEPPAVAPDFVAPEFKTLVDAVIAADPTGAVILRTLDARLAATPPGIGRVNLMAFRRQLVETIRGAGHG